MTSEVGPRRVTERFYLAGEVEWIPFEQGGRQSGPPQPRGQDYISTANLPPSEIDASFVLRDWDGSQRSSARGRWLVDENPDRPLVRPGDVVMVKEGARVVARFRVTGVDRQPAKTGAPPQHKGWLSRWRRRRPVTFPRRPCVPERPTKGRFVSHFRAQPMRSHREPPKITLMAEGRPKNPYEAARERMRRQDREAMSRYGRPFGPFLAKQVAAALVAGLVGYLIGGWITATVLFLGWLLPSIGAWLWGRRAASRSERVVEGQGEAL